MNKRNSELVKGIANATKILRPGGKIVVISFHSIEDKIIKYFFNNFSLNRSNPSRYFPENKKIILIYLKDIKIKSLNLQTLK